MFNSSSRSRTFLRLFHRFTQVRASIILACVVQKRKHFENELIHAYPDRSSSPSSRGLIIHARYVHSPRALRENPRVDLLVTFLQSNIFITCFCLSSCSVSLIVKSITAEQVQVSRYFPQ